MTAASVKDTSATVQTNEGYTLLSRTYFSAKYDGCIADADQPNKTAAELVGKLGLLLTNHNFIYSDFKDPYKPNPNEKISSTASGCILMQLAASRNEAHLKLALDNLVRDFGVSFVLGLRHHSCGGQSSGGHARTMELWFGQGSREQCFLTTYFDSLQGRSNHEYHRALLKSGDLHFARVHVTDEELAAHPPEERSLPSFPGITFMNTPSGKVARDRETLFVPMKMTTEAWIGDKSYNVSYQILRTGTRLFKGMTVPKSGCFANSSTKNIYAASPSWWSTIEVAQWYSENPPQHNPDTHDVGINTAILTSDVRLLCLECKDSVNYLLDKVKDNLEWAKKRRDDLRAKLEVRPLVAPAGLPMAGEHGAEATMEYALAPLDAEVKKWVRMRDCIKLATGAQTSFEEQLRLMCAYGVSVNDAWPDWCPYKEIKKRGIRLDEANNTFFAEVEHEGTKEHLPEGSGYHLVPRASVPHAGLSTRQRIRTAMGLLTTRSSGLLRGAASAATAAPQDDALSLGSDMLGAPESSQSQASMVFNTESQTWWIEKLARGEKGLSGHIFNAPKKQVENKNDDGKCDKCGQEKTSGAAAAAAASSSVDPPKPALPARKPIILVDADGTTWGPREQDLNRVSFSTFIDREILYAIAACTNFAGYCAGNLPSTWHYAGSLVREVAFTASRGILINTGLEIVGKKPEDTTRVAVNSNELMPASDTIVGAGDMSAIPTSETKDDTTNKNDDDAHGAMTAAAPPPSMSVWMMPNSSSDDDDWDPASPTSRPAATGGN